MQNFYPNAGAGGDVDPQTGMPAAPQDNQPWYMKYLTKGAGLAAGRIGETSL